MLSPRDPAQIERYTQTKTKWMEKDISCKWGGKSQFIYDKIDFKTKAILRDKGHCIIIKGTIQEDIALVNIYAPNTGASK